MLHHGPGVAHPDQTDTYKVFKQVTHIGSTYQMNAVFVMICLYVLFLPVVVIWSVAPGAPSILETNGFLALSVVHLSKT